MNKIYFYDTFVQFSFLILIFFFAENAKNVLNIRMLVDLDPDMIFALLLLQLKTPNKMLLVIRDVYNFKTICMQIPSSSILTEYTLH